MLDRHYSDGSHVNDDRPERRSNVADGVARVATSPDNGVNVTVSDAIVTGQSARLARQRSDVPFRVIAEQYGRDALEVLRFALDSKDFRTRFQAARDLAALVIKLSPMKEGLEGVAAALTPEEREERLAAALETAEVREWLISRGWTPPKAKRAA